MKNSHLFYYENKNKFHQTLNFINRNQRQFSKVDRYWEIRQKKFRYKFDITNKILWLRNESNLEKYDHRNFKNNFFKFFVFILARKIIRRLGIKNSNIDNNFSTYNLSQLNKNNLREINKIKLTRKDNKIKLLNNEFPERVFWLLKVIFQLTNFKKKLNKSDFAVDICSGPCIVPGYLNYKFKIKTLVIDLPVQMLVGHAILNKYFPDTKICNLNLRQIIKKYGNIKNAFKYFDIIFIRPEEIKYIKKREFSIASNLNSFQEMEDSSIKNYFNFLRKVLVKENIFINVNREKKRIDKFKYFEFSRVPYIKEDLILYEQKFKNVQFFSKVSGGSFLIKSSKLKIK